ncbi:MULTISPECIES: response regulator [Rhodobacterales]|jgi:two-component system chemotaxis response regulator CheY|uniref:Response regulator n=1 Tax=Pseudophaeobacter arcticus TaxID=385492 RepID=A0ABQ0APY8_9RHOB|nr:MULTISPECIES: response regulator [Rhodobacterales]OIQ32643.1 MAG: two-component system response regulator [Roseobacter sp. MedPE-SWchi]OIQ40389.1 MAG: two-component system response regulator [Roseobacter sp. MedPE-SWde]OIQ46180.1 MAG: two-component system response regulator [Roseobacter sp. MedPE-SW]UWS81951.1 response regulator [Phaeobacter sp. G2]EAQ45410.1 chemotaxis regulator protein [Roseobacter sp. MED193]
MKTKVLAIDDSRTIRNLLAATLEEAGFEYVSAVDGREGVDMYDDVAPDVVITDINMPNLDGFGVIEELRGTDINSKVPILVLTTESAPEMKARARNAGATGWITKPFDDASLIFALKRVTGAAA